MTVRRSRFDRTQPTARGRLGIGAVLGRTFAIWGKNFVPFTILALLTFSPLFLYTLAVIGNGVTYDTFHTWETVTGYSSHLLDLLVSGALIYGVVQQLRGQRAGIGDCVRVGASRMFGVIGVSLLILAFMAAVMIPVFVVAYAAPGASLLALLGGIALALITVMFWVAVPVSVVEAPGVSASLGRSRQLTSGHRWKIFFVILLLGILGFAIEFALRRSLAHEPTFAVVLASLRGDQKAPVDLSGNATYMLANVAVTALLGSLGAVASAVGYHDLRTSKESVGIEELAKVFE